MSTTFTLDQLTEKPKKATVKAKATVVKKPAAKREKPHWTVKLFKHIDALGDELRKEGKILK